jgi:hypothetical protein
MRPWLLLLATVAWLYAPDVALIVGYDPSGATYQANGLFGAGLALYALDSICRPQAGSRLVERFTLLLAAMLWALQFACDVAWTKTGPSAAICDDVTNRPINLICAAAVLGVAALADRLRGRDA